MKREIAEYVSRCLTCQQVKAEYQRPAGLLQPLQIPEWKWEHITMDFVVGLPATQNGHNGVWVIVDRLTKMAHFLPFNTKWSVAKLARYYVKEVVGCTVCQPALYPTGMSGSLPGFGRVFKRPWVPSCR